MRDSTYDANYYTQVSDLSLPTFSTLFRISYFI